MTKTPSGKIENGHTARSFLEKPSFQPVFHPYKSLLVDRVLEDFATMHEKAQTGIRQLATTTISRDGIIHALRRIEESTEDELSFFTDKYPSLPDKTRSILAYPALIKLSSGTLFQARHIFTALCDERDVETYLRNRGDLTYPTVKVFGRKALAAFAQTSTQR